MTAERRLSLRRERLPGPDVQRDELLGGRGVHPTGGRPDTTPPTVTGTSPSAGATGVSTVANVTATFSEAMAPTTITTSTFELRDGASTLVPAAVTYDTATRMATLNPAATLAPATSYTATVRGGATDPRVKDLAGNALASSVTWTFTTASGPADDRHRRPDPRRHAGQPASAATYAEILQRRGPERLRRDRHLPR